MALDDPVARHRVDMVGSRMTMTPDQNANYVLKLAQRIRPMLAGQAPEVIGGVFAELVSIWLAGHWSPDADERERMRSEQLEMLVKAIEELIPVQETAMREQGRYPDE